MLIFAICAVLVFLFAYCLLVNSAAHSIRLRVGEIVDEGYEQLETAVDTISEELVSTQENIDLKLNELERIKGELISILHTLENSHSVSATTLKSDSHLELANENSDPSKLNFDKPKFSHQSIAENDANDAHHVSVVDEKPTNPKRSLLVGFNKEDYATL